MHHHDVYSTHLREERTIKVCLPPGYEAGRPYPVLYCHDGGEFFTHGRIATIAHRRMWEGVLRPLVIVGITVERSKRTDEYAPDGARSAPYLRFVAEECIPFVESRYSLAPNGEQRLMAGVSLGATASLLLHLRYPRLFSRLLLFSGAFYRTALQQVEEVRSLPGLAVWMVVGRQETAVETPHGTYDFLSLNRSTRDLLLARGAIVAYQEADGQHLWGFWQRQLPGALEWVERQLGERA
ncbi:MAG: esterase family protein [Alicyclobacillus sp.]|nr:esterase family protein [Alicyclobacillus sp.]